jgi:hypothetical protein
MKTKQLMDLIALGEVAGQPESTPHVGAHDKAHDDSTDIERKILVMSISCAVKNGIINLPNKVWIC